MKRLTSILCAVMLMLTGCMRADDRNETMEEAPEIPDDIEQNQDGVPILDVYVTATDEIARMDIETYLLGVVAGEMRNAWPIEALKAQAILARTFTLKFLETKSSRYEGADISTDVSEAQAYNADKVNDNVRRAVEETKGIVMSYGGELPQAWFHAHSGGVTELPTVALDYKNDPDYLAVVSSPDSENAPEDVKNWTASFTPAQVGEACAACGVKTGDCKSIEIGEKGKSGRAKTLIVNGSEVSAASFRVNIGATQLKSTLLDSVEIKNGKIVFTGRGFGHGVGMSQWGAYELAQSGATAQSIVGHYYTGVDFVDLWE